MTARWSARLLLVLALGAAGPSGAQQVDYDAIRSGVAGCPALAADPSVGDLAAALCRPADATTLDLPVSGLNKFIEVRAGSFSNVQRDLLLTLARGPLGESAFARLRDLLLGGAALSSSQESLRRAWLTQAADPTTDPASADALRAQAEALVTGTFDASVASLLAARVDRDRLADLQRGVLRSLGPRNVLSSFDAALAQSLVGFVNFGTSLPAGSVDADGVPLFGAQTAALRAYPYFVGPDGVQSTADDLPYVASNAAAQAGGYSLEPPIAGTTQDRFDLVSGGLAVYSAAARRTVDSISSPGTQKAVEVYGVYNPAFLVRIGCALLGGTFSSATGRCTATNGTDLTATARALGCTSRAERGRAVGLPGVGTNADGDCVELNTASQSGSIVQYEVLGLLADPHLRPALAALEPVDLTDLATRSFGSLTAPARPPSPTANVAFPNLPASFSRRVDLVSGAPLASGAGATCRVRVNPISVPIGPNGVAGDADDIVPSAGGCLLWGPVGAAGAQSLQSPGVVAAEASSNQSLFHTLCTLSFDGDTGACRLDALNDPRTLAFTNDLLGGSALLGGALLDGLETVRTAPGDVVRRHPADEFATLLLPVNPAAANVTDAMEEDFGLVAEPGQAALLGCGIPFASPCTGSQGQLWSEMPALAASLGPRRPGGIDLLNSAASVVVQEFATVKALQADSLVGTTQTGASGISYLPGVNFSRNGSLVTRPGPGGTSIQVEAGSYLTLTPADVLALGPGGRASYQQAGASKLQADGWVEPMPWAVDPAPLAQFGAIVFQVDPSDPLAGQANVFVPGGEYCGRWMLASDADVATPFNQTCTLLETVSANLERTIIARSLVGRDEVFDPPESLAELVAMLDGDPENDATGDPISGPDGIFARNQRVFRADELDFEVVEARDFQQLGLVQIDIPAEGENAFDFMMAYDPNLRCGRAFCFLQVNDALTDPGDAQSAFALVLALPLGAEVDLLANGAPTGTTAKLNLARLSLMDVHALNRLLAGETVVEQGQEVRMSLAQRRALLGTPGDQNLRGIDLDGDGSTDLDRDRDGVYDGADDFTPGPVSDDEILCGSGLPGDLLQDGVQFEPWRDADAPGSGAFQAALPQGLAPRSPVFCRELNALLALTGPSPAQSDAFLWHDGAPAPGADGDADGWPDVVDSCPSLANRDQADADGDGVGDVCDNCTEFPNPRVSRDYLRSNPWATLTGGQRDDDHDGYGNACDARFPPSTTGLVGAEDLAEYRASNARARSGDTCGTTSTRPCAIFDLDETGFLIGSSDLARFRELFGKAPGPKCPSCPLACVAGPAGSCD